RVGGVVDHVEVPVQLGERSPVEDGQGGAIRRGGGAGGEGVGRVEVGGSVGAGDDLGRVGKRARGVVVEGQVDAVDRRRASDVGHEDDAPAVRADEQDVDVVGVRVGDAMEDDVEVAHTATADLSDEVWVDG